MEGFRKTLITSIGSFSLAEGLNLFEVFRCFLSKGWSEYHAWCWGKQVLWLLAEGDQVLIILLQYTHSPQWGTLGGGIPQESQSSLYCAFHIIHGHFCAPVYTRPLINPLRGPTASKNNPWIIDSCRSADFVLFEHSGTITLSRWGEVVKGVSGTIYCSLSCLCSALFTGMNALCRNSSVDSCTWVRWTLSPPGVLLVMLLAGSSGSSSVPFFRPKTSQRQLHRRQHHQLLAYSRHFAPGYYVPCQCSQ